MGALEFMWQIYRKGEFANRVLSLVLPVQNHYWILEVADAYLIDRQVPTVSVVLDILHALSIPSFVDAASRASLTKNHLRQIRECNFQFFPNPLGQGFARWIFKAGDLI